MNIKNHLSMLSGASPGLLPSEDELALREELLSRPSHRIAEMLRLDVAWPMTGEAVAFRDRDPALSVAKGNGFRSRVLSFSWNPLTFHTEFLAYSARLTRFPPCNTDPSMEWVNPLLVCRFAPNASSCHGRGHPSQGWESTRTENNVAPVRQSGRYS